MHELLINLHYRNADITHYLHQRRSSGLVSYSRSREKKFNVASATFTFGMTRIWIWSVEGDGFWSQFYQFERSLLFGV